VLKELFRRAAAAEGLGLPRAEKKLSSFKIRARRDLKSCETA
jgi:hypothetical protein